MLRLRLAGLAAIFAVVTLAACSKGSPADAPPDLKAVAGDGQVTLSWTGDDGVDWWVFYAPASTISVSDWTTITGAKSLLHAKSPQVIAGLTNGTLYSFVVNGRNNGGKGGPESNVAIATPRPAGNIWAVGSPIPLARLNGVSYVSSTYLAGGPNASVLWRSTDGSTWTQQSTDLSSSAEVTAIYTVSDRLMLFASDGTIRSSIDGTTFVTGVNPAPSLRVNAVGFLSGRVVAVGESGLVMSSTDAQVFGRGTSANTNTLRAVTTGAATLVAVGDGGTIVSSTDGANWNTVSSGTSTDLTGVGYINSRFVAVGAGGTWLSSTDGVTWTPGVPVTTANLTGMACGSQCIAVGSGGTALVSSDGISWSVASTGTTADLSAINYGGGVYIAVGAGGVNVSSR